MPRFLVLPAVALAATLAAGCGSMYGGGGGYGAASEYGTRAAAAPAMARDGALVGPNGMTLYTFDRDSAGKSACNGPCAQNWPPLMAGADARDSGDWSVVTRDDGTKQWAWKGKPVYYWVKDAKPGDRSGDGVNGVWHTARP